MSSAALQRLRQVRFQQQLLSLSQCNEHTQTCGAAQLQLRGLADQAPVLQFARQRKAFQNSLGELRKQWAKERLEKEAAKEAAAATSRAAQEARKVQRMQQDLESRERRQEKYQAVQAADRELRLAAKAERLKRAELRAEVLDVAREERRRQLLRQSCGWVTSQALDQRIQEALDNPVPLHVE